MFTKNVKRRAGRPPGQTARGAAMRDRLYETAIRMIATRGYEATTLRDIADEADISVGLLYRYFPSKRAVLIALYDALSQDFAERAAGIQRGRWRDRFVFALQTSLAVLKPHRASLRALVPTLVGDAEDGVFAPGTAFSRIRILRVFENVATDATDAPSRALAAALGRLLYLAHLGVILWWLLDKSPEQRATTALVRVVASALPAAAPALGLPPVRRFVMRLDALAGDALLDVIA